jgi:hypothetical protein
MFVLVFTLLCFSLRFSTLILFAFLHFSALLFAYLRFSSSLILLLCCFCFVPLFHFAFFIELSFLFHSSSTLPLFLRRPARAHRQRVSRFALHVSFQRSQRRNVCGDWHGSESHPSPQAGDSQPALGEYLLTVLQLTHHLTHRFQQKVTYELRARVTRLHTSRLHIHTLRRHLKSTHTYTPHSPYLLHAHSGRLLHTRVSTP